MNLEQDFFAILADKAARALRAARGLARVLGNLKAARVAYEVYVECCYFLGIAPYALAI